MEYKIDIPDYDPATGFIFKWEDGFEISTQFQDNAICISANTAGLISLANHLLNLAQVKRPVGGHIHLDDYNSLEAGSIELIIEKI